MAGDHGGRSCRLLHSVWFPSQKGKTRRPNCNWNGASVLPTRGICKGKARPATGAIYSAVLAVYSDRYRRVYQESVGVQTTRLKNPGDSKYVSVGFSAASS